MTGHAEHPGLQQSFDRLEKWVYTQDWRGWDPFDGLNSPLLHWLTFGNRFLGIGFTQLVKKSPFNLRPLLAIPQGHNAKSMGLFLQSSILRYAQTREAHYLTSIDFLARWLLDHASQGYTGLCWGYNFPWANRDFYIKAGVPNAVATVFVGQAFLTYARHADILPDFEETYGQALEEILTSICTFLIQDLNRLETAQDTLCFSYTPQDNRHIHNVNILCAQLLAETYAINGNPALKTWALKAARYTLAHQHENGAWFYGEAPKEQFIDNIHTGYILTGLTAIQENLPIESLSTAIQQGYAYWKKAMFDEGGLPKQFAHRSSAMDTHTIAVTVLTYLHFTRQDEGAYAQAASLLDWAHTQLQDCKGYFYYQKSGLLTNKIPYMRWVQAWMYLAYSHFLAMEPQR